MERRQFLALPATLAAGGLAVAQNPAPWHQRVRRIGQLNVNERDPVDLDVKAWADYWASLKVDAVLVSVTGIVAFYPTKLPNFRRAAFLGDRDLFGDCRQAAKQRGMRVIARFGPDLTWEEFLKVRPEWFVRDSQGRPSPQADAPGLLRTWGEESVPSTTSSGWRRWPSGSTAIARGAAHRATSRPGVARSRGVSRSRS